MTNLPPSPGRRRLRFSLRFLLLAVVAVAVPLGWKVNRVRNQRLVVEEIERLGGNAYYDYDPRAFAQGGPTQLPGPDWLRNLLGIDFLADVVQVSVDGAQVTNDTLRHLSSLPHLQVLGVKSDRITDDGVALIARSNELMSLSLRSASVTKTSIDHLKKLPTLVFLRCSGSQVDDSWLRHISELGSLESRSLNDAQITDEGLAALMSLPKLEGLFFENAPISGCRLGTIAAHAQSSEGRTARNQGDARGRATAESGAAPS